MTTDATTPPPGRDGRGRFQKGNAIARGNGLAKRMRALSSALDSVNDEDVARVLRQLHEQAVDGDVAAANLWLQHVCGRPRERAAEVAVDLPALDTAAGFASAFSAIAKAAAGGALEVDAARSLAQLLQQVSDAVVLRQIEQQLAEAQQKGGMAAPDDLEAWRQMQRLIPGRMPADPTTSTTETKHDHAAD